MNKKPIIGLLATVTFAGPLVGFFLARRAAARRRRANVQRLFALVPGDAGQVYHEAALEGLPAPVQRYFRRVLREGQPCLRSLRLRHTGQFKPDLKQSWVAITGEQYITADPPGFIWEGTTGQFVARDELIAGRGRLAVQLLGVLPIAGGTGPAYDQGELLRWLLECTWLPTALLPSNSIMWMAIDEKSARLTLTHRGQSVSCLARFNERDELAECEALRFMDATTQRPWVGRFQHYQERHGVLIPTVGEASWVVDGRPMPYARFLVQTLEYNPAGPY